MLLAMGTQRMDASVRMCFFFLAAAASHCEQTWQSVCFDHGLYVPAQLVYRRLHPRRPCVEAVAVGVVPSSPRCTVTFAFIAHWGSAFPHCTSICIELYTYCTGIGTAQAKDFWRLIAPRLLPAVWSIQTVVCCCARAPCMLCVVFVSLQPMIRWHA